MKKNNVEQLFQRFPIAEDEEGGGYVYFIRTLETPLVKIGYTNLAPKRRMADIQTTSPFKLELLLAVYAGNPKALEHRLHKRFAPYRRQGEWFELSTEIVTMCETFAELFTEGQHTIHAPLQRTEPIRLTKNHRTILATVSNECQTLAELCHKLDIHRPSAKETLRVTLYRLVKQGFIHKIGRDTYALSPFSHAQRA